jgi:hypothetical protein
MLSAWEADIRRASEPIARGLGAAAALCALLAPAAAATAGATRCWLDHGAVVAPAAFGDIAGDFIIDLSRPASALHDTRANADGITADAARGPLTVAGERIADLDLAVVDLDAETRVFDTVINGVIGWDVLGRYAVELDLRRGRCRLTLAAAGRTVRRLGAALPLTQVYGAPAIPAAVTDGLGAREGLFLIDTGQEAVRVADARLSRPRAGKDRDAPVQLRAASVGGALIEQVPAAIMDPPASGAVGTFGLSVWRGGVLWLDPARGRAVFWSPRQDH